jgi:hypothetical protein
VVPHAELGRLLTERDATFDRRAVLRAVAKAAVQGVSYPQILARADAFVAGAEAVEVSAERWSTLEIARHRG